MLKILKESSLVPAITSATAILVLWLFCSVLLNKSFLIDRYEANQQKWNLTTLIKDSWRMERPVLPSPQQVIADMYKFIFDTKITSKRSLVYYGWITLSSTLLGFFMGVVLGMLLSVAIVYSKTLKKSLMPWIIASQTVPILAIAPMIIVVLGSIGLVGLVPKSIISAYLCFFPIVIGMVKGLNSADKFHLDLLHTYNSKNLDKFFKLQLPSSLPFLITSLKIAVAASLVGAIVGELPTGSTSGLGARMLIGSYYGQTVKIWSALFSTSVIAICLVGAVNLLEKILFRMGFK